MQTKKLTPLEILQKQKNDLQAKSDELSATIENRVKYLQQNFTSLLRNSIVESTVSKLSPHLQSLAGSFIRMEQKTDTQYAQKSTVSKFILGTAIVFAEIAPLLIRGKKGMFLSVIVKQMIKWIG